MKREEYKKKTREEIKNTLTKLQREVTLHGATEAPFENEYDDNFEDGIYVDLYTGEALFTSKDKFNSGCGWPAFSKPIEKGILKEKRDTSFGMERVEVKSKNSDAHLGHVFTDGPKDLGGLRYCINSASIRFIKKEDLEELGYGEYLKLFE